MNPMLPRCIIPGIPGGGIPCIPCIPGGGIPGIPCIPGGGIPPIGPEEKQTIVHENSISINSQLDSYHDTAFHPLAFLQVHLVQS
jgi:hypothetical protein